MFTNLWRGLNVAPGARPATVRFGAAGAALQAKVAADAITGYLLLFGIAGPPAESAVRRIAHEHGHAAILGHSTPEPPLPPPPPAAAPPEDIPV